MSDAVAACPACNGRGLKPYDLWRRECEDCDGLGTIPAADLEAAKARQEARRTADLYRQDARP